MADSLDAAYKSPLRNGYVEVAGQSIECHLCRPISKEATACYPRMAAINRIEVRGNPDLEWRAALCMLHKRHYAS